MDDFRIATTAEKLLFAILEELKILNSRMFSPVVPNQEEKPQEEPIKEETQNAVTCKYCNGTHENRYQVAACAKKNKPKGGAKK